MIDLYTYRTSNGRKVSIMLEECSLEYNLHVVDITSQEQDRPTFRALNPNGRIPVIVDNDGPDGQPLAVFESGAILLYLAEKAARFLPADPGERWAAFQWLFWQVGGVGPNFGQAFHFLHQYPANIAQVSLDYGRDRYLGEVRRLCMVMDDRLGKARFMAGAEYSIADIATFPWIAIHKWLEIDLVNTPHLRRWYDVIQSRPAVRRGMDVPSRQQIT